MMSLYEILLSALGVIITGLATFAVSKLTSWINSKIGDAKAAKYLNTITELTFNAVKETYQVYVTAIKEQGSFDAEAQKKALDMCINKITTLMSKDVADYITQNFGDMRAYLITLIEGTIYSLKRTK